MQMKSIPLAMLACWALACGGGGSKDAGADVAGEAVEDAAAEASPEDAPDADRADAVGEAIDASGEALDLPVAEDGSAGDVAGDAADLPPADIEADATPDVATDAAGDVPADASKDWDVVAPVHQPFRAGLSTHLSTWNAKSRQNEMDLDAEAGIEVLRRDFFWSDMEATPGTYNFDGYDQMVEDAAARGMEWIGMLGYGVDWAYGTPGQDSTIDMEAYGRWAGACAAHFRGKIRYWEIWNEPNLFVFWDPQPDPEAYGRMLKAAGKAIHDACPECLVLTAGFGHLLDSGPLRPWSFVDEMWTIHPDLGDYFDVMVVHPYTVFQILPPEEDNDAAGNVPHMIDTIRYLMSLHGAMKPVWITEAGWPSAPPPPVGPETPPFVNVENDDQARYYIRGAVLAASRGASLWTWYTTFDGGDKEGGSSENWFGFLQHDPDTTDDVRPVPKPSYLAGKTMNFLLRGRTWEAEGFATGAGVRAHRFGAREGEAGDGAVAVVWNELQETPAAIPLKPDGWPARAPDRAVSRTGEDAAFIVDAGAIRLTASPDPVFLVWDAVP